MSQSSDSLWTFFIAGALGLTILVVAVFVAIAIAQRRYLVLHRTYARRLLAATDEERASVAREVHDDAVQHLTMVSNSIQLLASESPALPHADRERLQGIRRELQDLGASLRNLAYRLHPRTLERGRLKEALEQLSSDMERAYGLRVALDCDVANAIEGQGRVLAVYRIAQEALRNVVRHAGTDRAEVSLRLGDGRATLVVSDQGAGFDRETGERMTGHEGLGLLTMQERARLVGGTASVSSRPGEGTTVRASIPLEGGSG